jgi:hypothetical protein
MPNFMYLEIVVHLGYIDEQDVSPNFNFGTGKLSSKKQQWNICVQ